MVKNRKDPVETLRCDNMFVGQTLAFIAGCGVEGELGVAFVKGGLKVIHFGRNKNDPPVAKKGIRNRLRFGG